MAESLQSEAELRVLIKYAMRRVSRWTEEQFMLSGRSLTVLSPGVPAYPQHRMEHTITRSLYTKYQTVIDLDLWLHNNGLVAMISLALEIHSLLHNKNCAEHTFVVLRIFPLK